MAQSLLGTEDKKPSIVIKDDPIALILRGLETESQELWMKIKYARKIYFAHLNGQIYISYKSEYCPPFLKFFNVRPHQNILLLQAKRYLSFPSHYQHQLKRQLKSQVFHHWNAGTEMSPWHFLPGSHWRTHKPINSIVSLIIMWNDCAGNFNKPWIFFSQRGFQSILP